MVMAGALGAGKAAWRWREPHWTYALACGAPILSLGLFLLLLSGLASKGALIALCLAAAALGGPGWRKTAHWTRPPWIAVVFAPFAVLYAVNALAPPTQPDAVTYHLGLVAEWLRLHGFATRIGFYEMLPLGLETLFAPAVAVGGFSAASLFHLLLLGATVPLLWRVGRQVGLQREAAAGAAALYALSPIVGMSGVAAYNDAGGVFFTVAVFALLLEDWRAEGDHWLAYAGLAAGFCYAVKVTGLLVVVAALAWILWRRRWRGAAWFSASALVSILPWMLRDLVLTGNPVAPLGNRFFTNDAFHLATEESLGQYLRDYGVGWPHLPWSIAVDGAALQGLIGPLFLLLPLAILAWKKPAGRAVLVTAAVLTLPWTQNLGARFLMPALAFYALALAMVVPQQLFAVVVVLHALSAWPAVMNVYSNPWAWRLKGMPWEAALRLQSEDAYLTANLYEYTFLKKAARYMKPNEPLLDLYGLPYAFLPTVPTGPLPSAPFDNMSAALDLAAGKLPEQLYQMRCEWPRQFIRAVRIRMEKPFPAPWSISEAGLLRDGQTVKMSRNWFVRSWPEPGDAWLAVDGNKASRWQSWSNSKEGMAWELRVDRPVPLDGAWAMMINVDSPQRVGMYIEGLDRQWRKVSDRAVMQDPTNRMYRRSAALFVKNAGYQWIAVKIGPGGHGPVGESMLATPDAWGVDLVERVESIGLFRIR